MKHLKVLYTPSGRAGEYADHGYAVNLYRGCTHGCKYCYVPGVVRCDRAVFHASVSPRPNILRNLEQDLTTIGAEVGTLPEPIFLCFTCDPYHPGDTSITRRAIELILASGNAVNILTKGGRRAERDFDLLVSDKRNKIGATLTFLDEERSREWEPGAALPEDRMEMLGQAWNKKIHTWVSMEPVLDMDTALEIINLTSPYVDHFKVGRWNHSAEADKMDWAWFAREAKKMLDFCGNEYTIKADLLKAIDTAVIQ